MNRDERIAVVLGALAQAWHLTSPSDQCGTVMVRQAVTAVDKAWTDPPAPIDPVRMDNLCTLLLNYRDTLAWMVDVGLRADNAVRDAYAQIDGALKMIEELKK